MFSRIFIERPIFASVISIVITLLGAIAMTALPIARYPEIAPPTVTVTAAYPGADAVTVAETVAAPIEEQVNGVDGMLYLSSVCSNSGAMNLTVTFKTGTDVDNATVLVQNRVSAAEPRLPEEVRRMGVTVKKSSTESVMYIAVSSPDETYDDLFLSNYVSQRIQNEIARVPGVGDVQNFGTGDYSMRVWLDVQALKKLGMTAQEVINAIRDQNVQVAAGQIGAAPAPPGTTQEFSISVNGRLSDPEEFRNIVVKTSSDGRLVRVRDVGRVELGADEYSFFSQLGGKPSATIAVYQIPGSNIMSVAEGVKAKMEDLALSFPKGLTYTIAQDSTDIISASIDEVIITLFITTLLVVLTVFLFLQDWRATLIPAVTIPVSLIGTFAVMLVLGYSINILTLFGLVLVIGIVVDDAIVVVENVSRHLAAGLKPKEATLKAMEEVSGPVIATTLVLLAVFVPTVFMSGITGQLFRQFAVTISVATVFSSINALTLSPALCGIILRAPNSNPGGLFRLFNLGMDRTTSAYTRAVKFFLRKAVIGLVLFLVVAGVAVWGLARLPSGFVPQEDEGYCLVVFMGPDGSSIQETRKVADQINAIVAETPGLKSYVTVGGYSLIDGAVNPSTGFVIVTLDNWSERNTPETRLRPILMGLNRKLSRVMDATAFALVAPSLPGVGLSSGFTYMLQDRAGVGLETLGDMAQTVITDGNAQTGLTGMSTTFRATIPQLRVEVDRDQVKQKGISLDEVFSTLSIYLGSSYVNDFTMFGKTYKVKAQSEGAFRATPDDIGQLELRGREGKMLPISAVAEIKNTVGPQTVTRFNLYPSIKILGSAAPGFSSGQALDIMESFSHQVLPSSMGFAWTDLSYQEKAATGSIGAIFLFSVVLVYLVLAAQYESWTIPISVCLSVPTALFGAVLGCVLRGYDNNVYTQIGIVLLIGLAAKSAILIVEFAKVQNEAGKSPFDAALDAARLRFRAVLMTAVSFILGVIPLVIASGAGAHSRQVLGTVVFVGMLVATAVSLLCVPMLYFLIQTGKDRWGGKKAEG